MSFKDRCVLCWDRLPNGRDRSRHMRLFDIDGKNDRCGCKVNHFGFGGLSNYLIEPLDPLSVQSGRDIFLNEFSSFMGHKSRQIYIIADHATPIPQIIESKEENLQRYCYSVGEFANQRSPLLSLNLSLDNYSSDLEQIVRGFYIGSASAVTTQRGPQHIRGAIAESGCPQITLKTAAIYQAAIHCRCYNFDNMRLNCLPAAGCTCIRIYPLKFGNRSYFSEKNAIFIESLVRNIYGCHTLTNRLHELSLPRCITQQNRKHILSYIAHSIKESMTSSNFGTLHFWQFHGNIVNDLRNLTSSRGMVKRCQYSDDTLKYLLNSRNPQTFIRRYERLIPVPYNIEPIHIKNHTDNTLIPFFRSLIHNNQNNPRVNIDITTGPPINLVDLTHDNIPDPQPHVIQDELAEISIHTALEATITLDDTVNTAIENYTVNLNENAEPNADASNERYQQLYPPYSVSDENYLHLNTQSPQDDSQSDQSTYFDFGYDDNFGYNRQNHLNNILYQPLPHPQPRQMPQVLPQHEIFEQSENIPGQFITDDSNSQNNNSEVINVLQDNDIGQYERLPDLPRPHYEIIYPSQESTITISSGYSLESDEIKYKHHTESRELSNVESDEITQAYDYGQDGNDIFLPADYISFDERGPDHYRRFPLRKKRYEQKMHDSGEYDDEERNNTNHEQSIQIDEISDFDNQNSIEANREQIIEVEEDQINNEDTVAQAVQVDSGDTVAQAVQGDSGDTVQQVPGDTVQQVPEQQVEQEVSASNNNVQRVGEFELELGDALFAYRQRFSTLTADTAENYLKIFNAFLVTTNDKFKLLCPYCNLGRIDKSNLFIHIFKVHGQNYDSSSDRKTCNACSCPLKQSKGHARFCRRTDWYTHVHDKTCHLIV